jgi:phytoene dehydrogenase-like protein
MTLILCDVTSRQLLRIAGQRLSDSYKRRLESFRYGPDVFKVDYGLNSPIPRKASACLRAATVHLAGSFEEIAASERAVRNMRQADSSFVLLAQPSLFDPSRAPAANSSVWPFVQKAHPSPFEQS